MARADQLVRRSTLIVPVNVPRFVERAHARGADAIALDLEDSIPLAEKAAARSLVRDAIPLAAKGGADVIVRINKPRDLSVADCDAAVWPGVDAIMFPKAETAAEVHALDRLLAEREQARGITVGSIGIWVAIESAIGVENMAEILSASPRIDCAGLGPEDLTRDLGIEPTPDGEEQAYARGKLVIAARVAGVEPMGLTSTLADYTDLDGLRRSARRAATLGYRGASCIHPAQVPVLNEAFSPDPERVAHARRVLAAYDEAEAAGRASASLDGKMIDVPVAERARLLLARAAAVAARDARTRG